uniref:Target of rapamycin complex subunit lst8 n=1 Tax=Homalodisca liturata TaxID=320908 RepID=A0A1B6JXY3_9HEMI
MSVLRLRGISPYAIMATGGYDHTIRMWGLESGMCTRIFRHEDCQVNCLAISPNRRLIISGGFECIRIYDVNQTLDSALLTNNKVEKNVLAVGIEEEGKWMYTAGEDNTVRLYDLRALNMKCQKVFQTDATVNCACLHPSQKMMAVGDQKGIIHLWDLKSDHSKQLVPEPGASIQSIAMDPNGKYMAAVTNRGRCFIWELPAMFVEELTLIQHRAMIEAHQRYALRCKFSPDSKLLITSSADQTARLWKMGEYEFFRELKRENQKWVWDVGFTADSKYVVTVSSDCLARLWKVENGVIMREYGGHEKAITAVAVSDSLTVPPGTPSTSFFTLSDIESP